MMPRARMLAAALAILVIATAAALLYRATPPAESGDPMPRERGQNATDSDREAGRAAEEAPAPGIPADDADAEDEPDTMSGDSPGEPEAEELPEEDLSGDSEEDADA